MRKDLNAGQLAESCGADLLMQSVFGVDGALVAIAEGVGEGMVVGVDANIVDSPAIDSDRSDALGGDGGALAKAFIETGLDHREIPAQAAVELTGGIREPMGQRDGGLAVEPAKQRDATALCAQVHRNRRSHVVRRRWILEVRSSQIGLGQAAVDRDEVAGGATCERAGEKENGLRAIFRIDGLMGKVRVA